MKSTPFLFCTDKMKVTGTLFLASLGIFRSRLDPDGKTMQDFERWFALISHLSHLYKAIKYSLFPALIHTLGCIDSGTPSRIYIASGLLHRRLHRPSSSPRTLRSIPTSPMAIETVRPIEPSAGAPSKQKAEAPTSFVLPDLVSHCNFPLVYHANGDAVAHQSVTWLDANCPDLNAKQRVALRGLQAGELTAYCYNTAADHRLRVVSDFMNYLFHLYVLPLLRLMLSCT